MSLEQQLNETVRQIEELDSIIAENDAKVHELAATSETINDELELRRVQARDLRSKQMELDEQLVKVDKRRRDKRQSESQSQHNSAQHLQQDQLLDEIADREDALRQLEAGCLQLQHEIEQERHARMAVVKKLAACTEDLFQYIQKRNEEGLLGRDVPLNALRRIKELERERERDLQGSVRDLREAEAIVAMKTNKIQKMKEHIQKETADKALAKQNEAEQLLLEIEDSKRKLLWEIQDLENANKEQASSLRRGNKKKGGGAPPSGAIGSNAATSASASGGGGMGFDSHPMAADSMATPLEKGEDQQILEHRNRQLMDEKKQVQRDLAELNRVRRETIQKSKQFKQQSERNQRVFEQEMSQLHRDYDAEKKRHEQYQKENKLLEERLTQQKFIMNKQQKAKNVTEPTRGGLRAGTNTADGGVGVVYRNDAFGMPPAAAYEGDSQTESFDEYNEVDDDASAF